MSRSAEEVNKLTESTYKNVMEQFNPGLRNLVNLGKNYEKSVAAMTLAGRLYFDAMAKIGESAVVSPVSRELGTVLIGISEVHRQVFWEWEDNATFKRYQMEHKVKQDSVEKSQADLKRLRRKSQGKNAGKYENKESECVETLTGRQMDMRLFVADGCREALLEEKRRFCFLVDKHCLFSYQMASLHDKARDILMAKLSGWQERCDAAADMPESVVTMIEGLRAPVSVTPLPSPSPSRHSLNVSAPPAPSQKAHVSPLVNMFSPDDKSASRAAASCNDAEPESNGENNLAGSVSAAAGLDNAVKRPRVRTVFPHTGGNDKTLLGFDEGDVIVLLIPEEKDGWMYGEMEKNGKRAGPTASPDRRPPTWRAATRFPPCDSVRPSPTTARPRSSDLLVFPSTSGAFAGPEIFDERPRRHGDDVHARTCEKNSANVVAHFSHDTCEDVFGGLFYFCRRHGDAHGAFRLGPTRMRVALVASVSRIRSLKPAC
ncbi:brain-specific angiogenesis inhibitor 1-associated protein 2-like protein 1b isoform X4 [Phycodurus eques]|uniref:brain-specific angiogenesis inhibitor 1-associated protein 2-like protein 1b isoform X4 n=1 Tax=Phycodurus eques TaxID=693459 RepID=UPI002ACD844A|nr:brain-specific angiogenesis inhibitor 1-associated protein 2-like protein 1b isoform X4 [Phycodurus eques]